MRPDLPGARNLHDGGGVMQGNETFSQETSFLMIMVTT